MKLSTVARRNIVLFSTGFVVLSAILPDHRPWAHGWAVLLGGTWGAGFLIGLLSVFVAVGYRRVRSFILQKDDASDPFRRELDSDEVLIVFCVSLLAVSAIYLVGAHGGFSSLEAAEDFSLR